eukprot:1146856-Pelagomonas_calceolata.AAC.9
MCPAVLPTALEATNKLGCPDKGLCLFCMPTPATASYAPLTLQGCLDYLFGRVASTPGQGCPGQARAAGVKFTRKQANLGAHSP